MDWTSGEFSELKVAGMLVSFTKHGNISDQSLSYIFS